MSEIDDLERGHPTPDPNRSLGNLTKCHQRQRKRRKTDAEKAAELYDIAREVFDNPPE
ncbi:MAG: hypothetical protein RIC14_05420 [Filomicrobium sp.]